MDRDLFIKEVERLGIKVTGEKLNKLDKFYKILIEWNEKINLTGITEEKEVFLKHFYDSLTIANSIDLTKTNTLCDVGSGAGFPGIVLKIFFPNLKITLIDSLNKRIIYLNDLINRLEFKDIEAIHSRMEDYSKLNEEKFDIITARAVGSTKLLSEISVKALKINGYLIFMKGNIDEELTNIDNCLKELGLEIINIDRFQLPIENSNRSIITIKKNSKTKNKYPRSVDKIKKEPL